MISTIVLFPGNWCSFLENNHDSKPLPQLSFFFFFLRFYQTLHLHNWRTMRAAGKQGGAQNDVFCWQAAVCGPRFTYDRTLSCQNASPQWQDLVTHIHAHTHACMHVQCAHCRHIQVVIETPRSQNNWISVRGIKRNSLSVCLCLLSDSLCKSSLIYIPDRPDVSPICFKTYICVKWVTL